MFISVGTLGESTYAAPEEMSNSPQFSEKCDVFSLGLIVFEMATDAELKYASYKKLKDLRENGPAPSLTKDLTPELMQLVTMMMTPDPDKRPSVKQLLELPRVRSAVMKRHNQHQQASSPSSCRKKLTASPSPLMMNQDQDSSPLSLRPRTRRAMRDEDSSPLSLRQREIMEEYFSPSSLIALLVRIFMIFVEAGGLWRMVTG